MIKEIPLSWKMFHVKGHQDNGDTYNNIYEWYQMNIEADRISKYGLASNLRRGNTSDP